MGNKGKRLKGFAHIPEGFSFFLSSEVLGLAQCLALEFKRKTKVSCASGTGRLKGVR